MARVQTTKKWEPHTGKVVTTKNLHGQAPEGRLATPRPTLARGMQTNPSSRILIPCSDDPFVVLPCILIKQE
jgi:hypothetical protein